MKPRIYLRHGVWCCRAADRLWPIGHGYSPEQAIEDWRAQECKPEPKSSA